MKQRECRAERLHAVPRRGTAIRITLAGDVSRGPRPPCTGFGGSARIAAVHEASAMEELWVDSTVRLR